MQNRRHKHHQALFIYVLKKKHQKDACVWCVGTTTTKGTTKPLVNFWKIYPASVATYEKTNVTKIIKIYRNGFVLNNFSKKKKST